MITRDSELFLDLATDLLSRGHRVRFRAEGGSMHPYIRGGEAIVVEPVQPQEVRANDVLLYRNEQRVIAHRVVEVGITDEAAPVFTVRGDATGCTAERVESRQVLGRVSKVENEGRGAMVKWLSGRAFGWRAFAAFVIAAMALFAIPVTQAQAQCTYTSNAPGTMNWNGATWTRTGTGCGGGTSWPGQSVATDIVVIANGDTVTLNTSPPNAIASLQVGQGASGTLTLGNSTTNRTLTVTGNVTVSAGATLNSGGNGGNVLNIGGNLASAGTFDMNVGAADTNVVFNGTTAQTISGAGATMDFSNVTVSNTTQPVTMGRNFTIGATMTVNSGATFNTDAFVVSNGTGTPVFTLTAGGTLGIGDANGITTAACGTGATCGNIRTTTRTFPVGGNYTYNGTVSQNVGTGVPTNLTGALTINNPGNTVTLNNARTIANTGTVTIVDGTFDAGSNLTMASTSNITRSGGTMTGTPQGAGIYYVTYYGSAELLTSSETSGTGLSYITLSGTVVVRASSAITMATNGVLDIGSGTTFIQAGTDLAACTGNNLRVGQMVVTGNFANCATGVNDSGGTGTLTFTGSAPNLSVAATGRFDYLGTGTITFVGQLANVQVAGGGTIRINGGSNACNSAGLTITSTVANTWTTGTGNFFLADVLVVRQVTSGGSKVLYGASTIGTGSSGWTTNTNCNGSFTLVDLESFTAEPTEKGIRISIKTNRDVNNLGFNLYREVNEQRVKLNASLLAGTALLGGAGTTFTAGQSRRWLDRNGQAGAVYWLEEVDLSGVKTWYGPAVAALQAAGGKAAAAGPDTVERLQASHAAMGRAGAREEELESAMTLARMGRTGGTTASIAPKAAVSAKAAPTPKSVQKQYELAAGATVRLGVKAEGWYRVTQPQLVAAGISAGVDPRTLQLYLNGVEQPIHVESAAKNQFGANDALYFYGTGIDSTWSDTQAYWLVAGPGNGRRMNVGGSSRGAAGASSFPATASWKPRELYFPALGNGDEGNFFGPVVTDVPVTQALTVNRLDASGGAARLLVKLQGITEGAHTVTVALNGTVLGKANVNGQGSVTASFTVAAVNEGANTLTLTAANADDVTAVDEVLLTYPRSYTAEGDVLRVTALAGASTRIDGFGSSSVTAVDVTDPANPSLLQGEMSGSGSNYALTVVPASGSGTRTLLVVGSSQIQSPTIAANTPSSWNAAQAGYKFVILTHKSLAASAAPLAALRVSEGLTTKVIDVEDLYDEFNFGVKSPHALRAFLANAKAKWTTKPQFVLLLGNGTFDPRNHLATNVPDLVPVKLVDTAQMETASDDWFVDFDDDGIPDMAVGRLPAETAAAATHMVNRTVTYSQAATAPWMTRALLVSGEKRNATDDFVSQSATVQSALPGTISVTNLVQATDPNAAVNLRAAFNAGQVLVNFLGHGSTEVWAGSLFDSAAAQGLTNSFMAPVVLTMTCLNGYFHDVYTTALGKSLLTAPNGGAVAVWASSGLTEPDPQGIMNQAMVSALYGTPAKTLGEASAAAKAAIADLDVRRTWNLLGDPTTVIQP